MQIQWGGIGDITTCNIFKKHFENVRLSTVRRMHVPFHRQQQRDRIDQYPVQTELQYKQLKSNKRVLLENLSLSIRLLSVSTNSNCEAWMVTSKRLSPVLYGVDRFVFHYTVCDKENQVQSMQSITDNEFNQSALIQMKNLIENY